MAQPAVSDSRQRLASVHCHGGCVSSWRGSDWFGVEADAKWRWAHKSRRTPRLRVPRHSSTVQK